MRTPTRTPSPPIRGYVASALACLGDAEGLARLARDLDDSDAAIRASHIVASNGKIHGEMIEMLH